MSGITGEKQKKIRKKKPLIIVISRSSNVVQDQLFKGYQDFFGNFELQQPQRYKRILEDDGGDLILSFEPRKADYVSPVLPSSFALTWWQETPAFRIPVPPLLPVSHPPLWLQSVGLCLRAGGAGRWASCSRRYWLAVSCQQPGGEWELCTDTASQKSESEPFFSSDA